MTATDTIFLLSMSAPYGVHKYAVRWPLVSAPVAPQQHGIKVTKTHNYFYQKAPIGSPNYGVITTFQHAGGKLLRTIAKQAQKLFLPMQPIASAKLTFTFPDDMGEDKCRDSEGVRDDVHDGAGVKYTMTPYDPM